MEDYTRAAAIFPIFKREDENDIEYTINETKLLASTCNINIVKEFAQKKDKIDPSTIIGSGKIHEVHEYIKSNNIHTVIFNFELSPSQLRNIQKILDIEVIDRSKLILEIFRRNARTKEAKLQIDLAKLKYELPRLIGKRKSLEQFQIGMGLANGKYAGRGPGEKQIEYDRRTIKRQIFQLTKEIKQIESRKKLSLKKRTEERFIITLIGYTNAGKSSLFNRLTNSNVITKNTPFSTLDTKSALLKIEGNLAVFLNDTVGFIQNIPTDLITSFLTTLEDIKQSDLLIHVVDSSFSNYEKQIEVAHDVLTKLDCNDIKKIMVFNKIDLLDPYKLNSNQEKYPDSIPVSANNGANIGLLTNTVFSHIMNQLTELNLHIPITNGGILPELYNNYSVRDKKTVNSHIDVKVVVPKRDIYKYTEFIRKKHSTNVSGEMDSPATK